MRVGIVGTGYAARARARAIQEDGRATLVWLAGRSAEKIAQEFGCGCQLDIPLALQDPGVDLVFICTANSTHGEWVRLALMASKHVVVEYPLALSYAEGTRLSHLAQHQQRLLHVEHIELLSPIHGNLKTQLPLVGQPLYARYSTQTPAHPAPQKWSYHGPSFGFPLIGAVSRLGRLIDLLGPVAQVSCQSLPLGEGYFKTCYCLALLRFTSGAVAQITYAKGEGVWQSQTQLAIQGTAGSVVLDGDVLCVTTDQGETTLPAGGRQGLFLQDTRQVLNFLRNGDPLYVSLEQALYALRVADACATAAASQTTIILGD